MLFCVKGNSVKAHPSIKNFYMFTALSPNFDQRNYSGVERDLLFIVPFIRVNII